MTDTHLRAVLALGPEHWISPPEQVHISVLLTMGEVRALIAAAKAAQAQSSNGTKKSSASQDIAAASSVPDPWQAGGAINDPLIRALASRIQAILFPSSSTPAMTTTSSAAASTAKRKTEAQPRAPVSSKKPIIVLEVPRTKGKVSAFASLNTPAASATPQQPLNKATTSPSSSDDSCAWHMVTSFGSTWEGICSCPSTLAAVYGRLGQLSDKDANTRMSHVVDVLASRETVTSGIDAIQHLVGSASLIQRLALAVLHGVVSETTPFALTLIRRLPMTPATCFRAFVHDGRVTCVSQLMHWVWYPALGSGDNRLHHGRKVAEYVLVHVAPRIATPSFIVDVCMHKSGPFILCLHPFSPRTEALLFSWVTDNALLHQGPLTTRVCTAPPRHYLPGCAYFPSSMGDVVAVYFTSHVPIYDDEDPAEVFAPVVRAPFTTFLRTCVPEIAQELLKEAELDMATRESHDAVPLMLAAVVLAEGWGVPRDVPAAITWLQRAQERGNTEAPLAIAELSKQIASE